MPGTTPSTVAHERSACQDLTERATADQARQVYRRRLRVRPGRISIDDGNGLDLDEPLRQCQRGDADEGARWWRALREEGRSRLADDGSVRGFIGHDVGSDLDDVRVGRTGGGGMPDQAHHAGGVSACRGPTSNMHVISNSGTGDKTVAGNTVKNIICLNNDPLFVGGPNGAQHAVGQCF